MRSLFRSRRTPCATPSAAPAPGAAPSPVPPAAALATDLARASARLDGRPVTLDDLDRADLLAAVLVERWERRATR